MRLAIACVLLATHAACGDDAPPPASGALQVRGDLVLDLAWTAETAGCPYVADRLAYTVTVLDDTTASVDPPATIAAATIAADDDRATADFTVNDTWGVGPDPSAVEDTAARVVFTLTLARDGTIRGFVDGTVAWQGRDCTSRYQVDGSFDPVFAP